ncbi:MAG: GNAT family N-acetyltransferase [Candidatus Heimdallarchaeota archaeon]|nr:MAG: GNAT family N-acetyltransferase [Candidatus Heimdallarchaeota archaeon]
MELSDVDELMKHWNKPELQQFRSRPRIASRDEEISWIRDTWERRRKGEAYIFGIFLKENELYIGNIELRIISNIVQRASTGIGIFNPDYWGQGLGTEATELILDYGFSSLNLHSIELEVFSFNKRAIACYKKVGFVETGRKREAHFMGGKYYDIVLMDISAQEFASKNRGE